MEIVESYFDGIPEDIRKMSPAELDAAIKIELAKLSEEQRKQYEEALGW